jgi:excisionase family DNA binding protein
MGHCRDLEKDVDVDEYEKDEKRQRLRIHPKTLRTKARRGVIPGVQVGRLWRFRASALNEWLDEIAS